MSVDLVDVALSAVRALVLVFATMALAAGVRHRRHWSLVLGPAAMLAYYTYQLFQLLEPSSRPVTSAELVMVNTAVLLVVYGVARAPDRRRDQAERSPRAT